MDPTTKILTWITVAIAIFFEVMTAFFRALIGNQEQLSSLGLPYKIGGSVAVVRICAEPPTERLWVYTACRVEWRPEGVFLILATYTDFNMAKEMKEVGFRVRSTTLLSDLQ